MATLMSLENLLTIVQLVENETDAAQEPLPASALPRYSADHSAARVTAPTAAAPNNCHSAEFEVLHRADREVTLRTRELHQHAVTYAK